MMLPMTVCMEIRKEQRKERDYAAFEREKMKKDDPNWKHKKGSTSEGYQ